MNPEAVKWLEEMSPDDHDRHFRPALPCVGQPDVEHRFYSIKEDHECRSRTCPAR